MCASLFEVTVSGEDGGERVIFFAGVIVLIPWVCRLSFVLARACFCVQFLGYL